MSTRKRNEWLDADDVSEEEEEAGYDSELEEKSKGSTLTGRASKRRKVDDEDGSDIDESADEAEERDETPPPSKGGRKGGRKAVDTGAAQGEEAEEEEEEEDELAEGDLTKSKEAQKPLTAKQLLKSQKAAKKTGVIYLSRIPPFMKPSTVKSLLTPFGPINRIFLTPEDASVYARRKAGGGNKKRSFVDGWVEFVSKRDAKACVAQLNAQIVGGRKGGYYHDDVWNMRYLKGFKWHHLTDQIANENAERASRMRAEIARSTRENREFLANVERAKMLEGMKAKENKRKSAVREDGAGGAAVSSKASEVRRQFKQNEVKARKPKDVVVEQPEEVKRVLSKIF